MTWRWWGRWRHPDRCSGLVLLCGSYGFPLDTVHDDTMLRRVFPFLRVLVELMPNASRKITSLMLRTELALQIALEVGTHTVTVSDENGTHQATVKVKPGATVTAN